MLFMFVFLLAGLGQRGSPAVGELLNANCATGKRVKEKWMRQRENKAPARWFFTISNCEERETCEENLSLSVFNLAIKHFYFVDSWLSRNNEELEGNIFEKFLL
jgi:hypothetical protein